MDFKAERKPDMEKMRARLEPYRRQLHIYAHLVEERTGQKVSKMHLYYTGEGDGVPTITYPCDSTSFEEKQYGDIWTNDEYLQFMYERLLLMRELLSDKGSIFMHCDWHKNHHLRCLMDEAKKGNG